MENRHRAVAGALMDHYWKRANRNTESPQALKSLALTRAIAHGDSQAVNRQLKPPLDPNATNPSGYTALAMAAAWGHAKAVRALLATGFKPAQPTRSRYHSTPLMDAGADANQPDRYGDHALNWAAFFGHLELVKLWVERGSRLDVTGQTPDTALAIATREKHLAVAAYLRSAGALN